MHELEKQTMESLNKINQVWIDSVQEAKKSGTPLDITPVMAKYSEIVTKQMQAFRDYKERAAKTKKGLFG